MTVLVQAPRLDSLEVPAVIGKCKVFWTALIVFVAAVCVCIPSIETLTVSTHNAEVVPPRLHDGLIFARPPEVLTEVENSVSCGP